MVKHIVNQKLIEMTFYQQSEHKLARNLMSMKQRNSYLNTLSQMLNLNNITNKCQIHDSYLTKTIKKVVFVIADSRIIPVFYHAINGPFSSAGKICFKSSGSSILH